MNTFAAIAFSMTAALISAACAGEMTGSGSSGGTTGVAGSGGNSNVGGATAGGGSGSGISCGASVCPTGQYCCNASCGVCAPMGAACIQIACAGTGGATSSGAACTKDADCRLYDDYCGGCNCRAVPANIAVDPACGQSGMVQCLVAPCANKQAVCASGHCSVGG